MRRGSIGAVTCLTAFGVALALSACGSGGETTTAALSRPAFLKQGNAICQKGNDRIRKAAEKEFPHSAGKPSQQELDRFASQTVIPNIQSQIDQLGELGVPSGDEEQVEAILNEAQASLDKAKEEPAVMTQNGPGPFAKTDELANAYGLTVCGSEGE
jgi:hypothetical protein